METKLLDDIHFTQPTPDSDIVETIKWWERRRIFYNMGVILTGLFVVAAHWLPFQNPLYSLLMMLLFLICCNVFYSVGWGIEVLSRVYNGRETHFKQLRSWLFCMELYASIIATVYISHSLLSLPITAFRF